MDNHSSNINVILIDNFDSFTYNLVNQLTPLVSSLTIFRNTVDFNTLQAAIEELNQRCIIVISPGPGNPDSAGVTLELINCYKGKLPILGICLGHQAIIQSYGGEIGAAKKIIHGKSGKIQLNKSEKQLFKNLEVTFKAARYHSLAAIKMPKALKVIAECEGEVMAVKHHKDKILGFQFHPESILTPRGNQLMKNALNWLAE